MITTHAVYVSANEIIPGGGRGGATRVKKCIIVREYVKIK
jgi:hypothetical protein